MVLDDAEYDVISAVFKNEKHNEETKTLYVPRPVHCTDNGAMIALAGLHSHRKTSTFSYDNDVYCRSLLA